MVLFDGKSLDGWKVGTNAATFKIEDGLLVANGKGPSHLFYVGPVNNHDFKKREITNFIAKPFELDDLLARVAALCRRG